MRENRFARGAGIKRHAHPHLAANLQGLGAAELLEDERFPPGLDDELYGLAGLVAEPAQGFVGAEGEAAFAGARSGQFEEAVGEDVGLVVLALCRIAHHDERLEEAEDEILGEATPPRCLGHGEPGSVTRQKIEHGEGFCPGRRGHFVHRGRGFGQGRERLHVSYKRG